MLISFLFVQSKQIETALFPYAVLLQVTPIVAVAPLDHHLGQEPDRLDGHLRLAGGAVPDHLQHHARVAQRRPRLAKLFPHEPGDALADPDAACASRARLPYFFGGLRISSGLALIGAVVAEFVAGTGGSGAGPRLSNPASRFSPEHPAHVRRPAADLVRPASALFAAMAWLTHARAGFLARQRKLARMNLSSRP